MTTALGEGVGHRLFRSRTEQQGKLGHQARVLHVAQGSERYGSGLKPHRNGGSSFSSKVEHGWTTRKIMEGIKKRIEGVGGGSQLEK
ncbi:hypothetical protein C1H46_017366 [Malus baccata]|uniref:Uncharacterized protein n=1 Tax=Malus baccata TaxID=106549 RepID=A0A540MEA7_MALBA|nr:hypothetical protein C1H46_017366 [Malus baccata]